MMPTPPSTSEMFFSSSPRHETGVAITDLDDEVDLLLAQARATTELKATLSTAISAIHANFFGVFARQIQLIKSRSQAFEDCHITVYDKVLLALTQNGNELGNPAAITYYCEEYFGINVSNGNPEHNAQVLSDAIDVPLRLAQAVSPPPTIRGLLTSAGPRFTSPPSSDTKRTLFPTSAKQTQSFTLAALASQADPNLARLWTIYEAAKNEYIAVADLNDEQTMSCARFLRDTAENMLGSLQNAKNVDERLLSELENTYNMSKQMAVTLTGGKKRKFDQMGKGIDRKPSMKTEHGLSKPRNRHQTANSAEFAGHFRAMADHSYPERDQDSSRYDDRMRGVVKNRPKPKKPHKGRGPSGIPYGYSRPVDSYYPSGYH